MAQGGSCPNSFISTESGCQSLTLEEAKVLTLKVLKQVMEEKLDENNVELAIVSAKQRFAILKKDELKQVIDKIEVAAPTTEGEDTQMQDQSATAATASTSS